MQLMSWLTKVLKEQKAIRYGSNYIVANSYAVCTIWPLSIAKINNKATYLYIKGCGNTAHNLKFTPQFILVSIFESRVLLHTYAVSLGLSGFFPEKVSRSFPNTDVMFQHESLSSPTRRMVTVRPRIKVNAWPERSTSKRTVRHSV